MLRLFDMLKKHMPVVLVLTIGVAFLLININMRSSSEQLSDNSGAESELETNAANANCPVCPTACNGTSTSNNATKPPATCSCNYASQPPTDSSTTSSSPNPNYEWKGYVISMDEERYNHTAALLRSVGIQPIHVQPVPLNSAILQLEFQLIAPQWPGFPIGALSNKYTHRLAQQKIACDPDLGDNDFSFVFEDDIALHRMIQPQNVAGVLRSAAQAAQSGGVMYLGMCGADCSHVNDVTVANVPASRCCGRCLHAYGVVKRRAAWLYEELKHKAYKGDGHGQVRS